MGETRYIGLVELGDIVTKCYIFGEEKVWEVSNAGKNALWLTERWCM